MSDPHRRLLVEMLASFFANQDPALLHETVARVQWISLRSGDVLFNQGDPGSTLGFVLAGRLEVGIRAGDGSQRTVGQIARGELVGEIAFFLGERRTASVRAVRDTVIATLSRGDLDQLMESFPWLGMNLARRIIERLTGRERDSGLSRNLRSIGLVAHRPGVDLQSFARRLQLALLRFGSTSFVDHQTVRSLLGSGCDEHAEDEVSFELQLNTLLDRYEADHDFVLLVADPESARWTRKCLNQADKVLLVGWADADCGRGPGDEVMDAEESLQPAAGIDLVLLHPDDKLRPAGSGRWLAARTLARHHHLPWQGNSGFNRLARFLAGRTVSLVLAGGGARGFAHIGVIRAIREAGIPLDAVGGTSIGAVIGALVALGWSDESILQECKRSFADEQPLDDYTLPILALARGQKLERMLADHFGAGEIEDMWLPFFAVSANLSRRRVEVHDRGPLASALRATVSLPGILPPTIAAGDLLIDGGVLNNLPIDIMKDRVRGTTIAVDLAVDVDFSTASASMPSPFEYLSSRLLPWRGAVAAPTIMDVIVKTATLGRSELGKDHVDLFLNPPLDGFGLLDWQRIHSLVELGYHHAVERISAWSDTARVVQRDELFDSRGISRAARAGPAAPAPVNSLL